MQKIRIGEQIAFLRKRKGLTQEGLSESLGVTNQAVSKWEAGICCPDIALLPEIAKHFGVTIDDLLGYRAEESYADLCLKIKAAFESAPKEESFALAFKLAALLHEGAATYGYKERVPWDTDHNRTLSEDYYKWGFSARSEPEGATIRRGGSVFFADTSHGQAPADRAQLSVILHALKPLCDRKTLRVLYAVYDLTLRDFEAYAPLGDIARKCGLSADETAAALNELPIDIREATGGPSFRLAGRAMHIPPLLQLFAV